MSKSKRHRRKQAKRDHRKQAKRRQQRQSPVEGGYYVCSVEQMGREIGLSPKEAEEAMGYLQEHGHIVTKEVDGELRHYLVPGKTPPCCHPVPDRLQQEPSVAAELGLGEPLIHECRDHLLYPRVKLTLKEFINDLLAKSGLGLHQLLAKLSHGNCRPEQMLKLLHTMWREDYVFTVRVNGELQHVFDPDVDWDS